MRSISSAGKKHGVSLWRNGTGSPHCRSRISRKRRYLAGDQLSLNGRRYEGIKQERSVVHDGNAVDADIETAADHIDVRGGIPVRAGMGAIRIAEGDVNAGDLFVLQNIADH